MMASLFGKKKDTTTTTKDTTTKDTTKDTHQGSSHLTKDPFREGPHPLADDGDIGTGGAAVLAGGVQPGIVAGGIQPGIATTTAPPPLGGGGGFQATGAQLTSSYAPSTTHFDKQDKRLVGQFDKQGKAITQEQTMVLSEEQLQVGKQPVQAGGVEVQKRVETEKASVPITLHREDIKIERRPLHDNDKVRAKDVSIGSQPEIRATAMSEQAIVNKEVLPREEVAFQKGTVVENATVQGNVRRERAEVIKDTDKNFTGVKFNEFKPVAHGTLAGSNTGTSGTMGDNGKLVAHEERLAVDKAPVKTGEVTVKKAVDVVPQAASVALAHDEVKIDRKPLAGKAIPGSLPNTTAAGAFIPLAREDAVVGTKVVPKEEIVVKKDLKQETHKINDTLKRERIDVQTTTTNAPLDASTNVKSTF